jgi:hypothetical protein
MDKPRQTMMEPFKDLNLKIQGSAVEADWLVASREGYEKIAECLI